MKPTASARKTLRSRSSSTSGLRIPRLGSRQLRYVVCVEADVNVDLEKFKVYKVKSDRAAQSLGLIRVVDASGEDYLYPTKFFRPILAPRTLF
jgi:hypothetical protein